ncbi:polymorphic toxin type 50 domain-containing protein [Enterococcus mundtii]|uniref:polymorphic toxin type 50 domain-containing protein n=1 Tax=Enterococcus TaxID=1350 RepID=UPI00210CC7C1|nr:polymorphic toxin type 50 domain-containing protein [Enterococcus mundtii]
MDKFNRHVRGTKEYDSYLAKGTRAGQAPSYLTISAKKAQQMIDVLLTEEDYSKQSKIIEFPEIIGVYVNQTTGEKLKTNRAKIHISKTGIHIVPTKMEER